MTTVVRRARKKTVRANMRQTIKQLIANHDISDNI